MKTYRNFSKITDKWIHNVFKKQEIPNILEFEKITDKNIERESKLQRFVNKSHFLDKNLQKNIENNNINENTPFAFC